MLRTTPRTLRARARARLPQSRNDGVVRVDRLLGYAARQRAVDQLEQRVQIHAVARDGPVEAAAGPLRERPEKGEVDVRARVDLGAAFHSGDLAVELALRGLRGR